MNRYTKIKDFHGSRARGVGSSDIPILAGMFRNYGETTRTLWLEKTGRKTREIAGPRAEWGHRLEPMILAKWAENRSGPDWAAEFYAAAIRGKSCGDWKRNTECRMPDRKYVLAHADLLIDIPEIDEVQWPCIVEAKSSGFFAGKRKEGVLFTGYDPDDLSAQGIPDSVFLQVQWQLLAYDVPRAFVAVLIDTGDYREYGPILPHRETQERCLALAERFWDCVQKDKEPKPETWADITSMWPKPDEMTAMVSGDDEMKARAYAAEYWSLGERIDTMEDRREELKNALGIYIGENSILSTASGVKLASSWMQNNPPSVDLKRLKEEFPEVFARLDEAGIIRRTERRELRPAKVKGE